MAHGGAEGEEIGHLGLDAVGLELGELLAVLRAERLAEGLVVGEVSIDLCERLERPDDEVYVAGACTECFREYRPMRGRVLLRIGVLDDLDQVLPLLAVAGLDDVLGDLHVARAGQVAGVALFRLQGPDAGIRGGQQVAIGDVRTVQCRTEPGDLGDFLVLSFHGRKADISAEKECAIRASHGVQCEVVDGGVLRIQLADEGALGRFMQHAALAGLEELALDEQHVGWTIDPVVLGVESERSDAETTEQQRKCGGTFTEVKRHERPSWGSFEMEWNQLNGSRSISRHLRQGQRSNRSLTMARTDCNGRPWARKL